MEFSLRERLDLLFNFLHQIFTNSFITTFLTTFLAILLTRSMDEYNKSQKFLSRLKNCKSEAEYNKKDRGNEQSPFEVEYLRELLNDEMLDEKHPELKQKLSSCLQLALDANRGQLQRRKLENGVRMVPSHVQDMFKEIAELIDEILSGLESQAS